MMKLMHRSVHLRAAESFGHGLTQSSLGQLSMDIRAWLTQYNMQVVMFSHSQADSFRARHLASKLLPSVVCRKVVSSRSRRHSARMGEYIGSANTYIHTRTNTRDQRA
jgi:hypothetical protein